MGAVETTIREQASGLASAPSEDTVRTEKVRFVVPESKANDVDSPDGGRAEESTQNSPPVSKTNQDVVPDSKKDKRDSTVTSTAAEKDSAPSAESPITSTAAPAEKSVPAADAGLRKASLVGKFLSRSPKPEAKTPKPKATSTSRPQPMSKARSNIWQNVVDGSLLGTKLFTHAAVYDQLTGEQLACSSKDFAIPKEEAMHLAKATHQPGRLAATGIAVAGQAFNYSHGELGTALYGSDPMNKHRGIVIEAGDVYMIVAIFEENGEAAKKNLKEMISHFKEHYSF